MLHHAAFSCVLNGCIRCVLVGTDSAGNRRSERILAAESVRCLETALRDQMPPCFYRDSECGRRLPVERELLGCLVSRMGARLLIDLVELRVGIVSFPNLQLTSARSLSVAPHAGITPRQWAYSLPFHVKRQRNSR